MERRVALAGSSGLIGTAVSRALTRRGDTVVPLVRGDSSRGLPWEPARGEVPDLTGFDAVVPRVLHDGGFRFAHTTLPAALAAAMADEA